MKYTGMIRQTIHIKAYDWTVYAYYAVDTYYADEIVQRLADLGADSAYLRTASSHMRTRTLNNGLTYSNMFKGETVLVVGLTSSPAQFLNSLVHELQHLTCHVCEARGIDMNSEEACYLSGGVAQEIYGEVKGLI